MADRTPIDPETLRLWELLVRSSEQYYNAIYARLGITLTDADLAPESFYNPMLAAVCDELEQAGLAVISDGALCAFPPGFTGRDGQPLPLILRKSDGGYGYGTTDVAAIKYRTQELKANRLLYVADAFRAANYTPEETRLLAEVVRARVNELAGLGRQTAVR